MTDSFKKQLCYGGGTLAGWVLSKILGAKEAVPYTIMGGVIGVAVGDGLVDEGRVVPCKQTPIAGPKPRKKKVSH